MLSAEEILIRLVVATVLGSIVGIERERLDWAPGLRTHMLVCLGATLFMIVSAFGFADILGTVGVGLDPSRIAAQVVSGIGFLGAGTIILRREAIRGLTTAASIWTVAAVGLAVGGGLYWAAFCTTVLVVIILAAIKPLEKRIFPKRRLPRITLTVDRRRVQLSEVLAQVDGASLKVIQVNVERQDDPHLDKIQLLLAPAEVKSLAALIDRLRSLEGIERINYPKS